MGGYKHSGQLSSDNAHRENLEAQCSKVTSVLCYTLPGEFCLFACLVLNNASTLVGH